MQLVLNGEARTFEGDVGTVRDLLARLDLAGRMVAVEVNEVVVRRAEHETRRLADGDVVEIVRFVGGGA